MPTLQEYLTNIGQIDIRKDRITLLGELFKETHKKANEQDIKTMYKRIARLLKDNYNDYYELARVIDKTSYLTTEGSHWNYITVVMQSRRKGNVRK
jgi:hypothetical protein